MGHNRRVKVGIAGPVIAVRFGVNNVAQLALLLNFGVELNGVAGKLGTVYHHDTIGRGYIPEIAPSDLGLHENIAGDLLHHKPSFWRLSPLREKLTPVVSTSQTKWNPGPGLQLHWRDKSLK